MEGWEGSRSQWFSLRGVRIEKTCTHHRPTDPDLVWKVDVHPPKSYYWFFQFPSWLQRQFKLYFPLLYANCPCNFALALEVRILASKDFPDPDPKRVPMRLADDLARLLPKTNPRPSSEVMRDRDAAGRFKHLRGLARLKVHGLNFPSDFAVHKGMVKNEPSKPKCVGWVGEDYNGEILANKPRAIVDYGDGLAAIGACHYAPVEHVLLTVSDPTDYRCPSTRSILKGLNAWERAAAILAKLNLFRQPMMLGLDAESCDAHLRRLLLKLQHRADTQINSHPALAAMFRFKMKGISLKFPGLTCKCPVMRYTGEPDTGGGNCEIHFQFLSLLRCLLMGHTYVWEQFFDPPRRGFHMDFIVDGDDMVVFCEMGNEGTLQVLMESLAQGWGISLVFDSPTSNLNLLNFTRSQPMRIQGVWKMVRQPTRALSNLQTIRLDLPAKQVPCYIKTVARGLISEFDGVPVLGPLSWALFNCHRSHPWYKSRVLELEFLRKFWVYNRPEPIHSKAIDQMARSDFSACFACCEEEQQRLEDRIALTNWEVVTDRTEYSYDDWPQLFPSSSP
jgi:hypothetical protein